MIKKRISYIIVGINKSNGKLLQYYVLDRLEDFTEDLKTQLKEHNVSNYKIIKQISNVTYEVL